MAQQIKATIKSVSDDIREFQGQDGPRYGVCGVFSDDSEFATWSDKNRAMQRRGELAALIGRPLEFEADERPARNGKQQWNLKSWPGKPQPGGFSGGRFGGGGGGGRSYEKSPGEQNSIRRQVALKAAVEVAVQKPLTTEETLKLADEYYDWLVPPENASLPKAEAKAETGSAAPRQAGPGSGKPACPQCGKLDPVLQDREDPTKYFCWRKREGCGNKFEIKAESPVTQFKDRISQALRAKDKAALGKIVDESVEMTLDQKLTGDEASQIEDLLAKAKKLMASGETYEKWVKEKQAEAQEKALGDEFGEVPF